jgi:hypothetical protein
MRKLAVFAVLLVAAAAPLAAQTAHHFAADLPAYAQRLAQTPFVVTAVDAVGNKVAGYRGTVTFSSSLAGPDSSVDLPPDYTFTDADAGTHTFNVVFHNGYLHEVWVTDTATSAQGSDETNVQCPEMTLTVTNSGPMCPGSPVTLTAYTNASSPIYNWHLAHGGGGLVFTTQSVTTTIGGTWEVYVSDGTDQCLASAQTTVAYEQLPSITHPLSASGDFQASLSGDVNGPYTDIDWSVTHGGSIVAGQGTATVTIRPDPGVAQVDYGVGATRASTGCRQSNTASTSYHAALSADIATPGSICSGMSATASVPDGGAGTSYLWYLLNGTIVSGQSTPSIVFMPNGPGAVEISASVSRNGQFASGVANVAVDAVSAAIVSDPTPAVCAGTPATIDVALTGTPPFAVTWSDGMMQTGIVGHTASRSVVPDMTTSYAITSVADGFCSGPGPGAVRVTVLREPSIARSPESQSVRAHDRAKLSVDAGGELLSFQWFEGARGDTSKPAGVGPVLMTPPVDAPATYWVRVSNACGSISSAAATVAPVRGRAARH